ncbi:MAG: SPOR domain-containing protein [Bacteroidaceae bacterium]|jgi:cell division protein FtsN|nr:SPOR domain-containing protein [Bacteroidaceae bacterium]MDO4951945.1 SPOR domain-containing protein [Bacteroidales bacterium]MBR3373101.1 SPOR domain-containing protein [Bacteroidaceae bacterium]MBR3634254.1 SPOR domain-containing protein [Bacteroidaceae bacterium]MBR3734034.1 SPOR domain-containing protein [Bacteroidaceae bacterium]
MNKTKTLAAVALGMVLAISMSSCKSKESLYKKAYEKAQAQNTRVTEDPTTVNVTPVQPVAPPVTTVTTETTETTVAPVTDVSVRSEALQVVDGDGLKAYSVVCGAFSLKANADGLQQTLKNKGYQAQIALNPERKLYRVVAATFNTKAEAIPFLQSLRETYPDAWLLYKK